jgi:hypothetical protein
MTVGELRERMGMAEMLQWSRWHALRVQREQLEQAQAEAKHGR